MSLLVLCNPLRGMFYSERHRAKYGQELNVSGYTCTHGFPRWGTRRCVGEDDMGNAIVCVNLKHLWN